MNNDKIFDYYEGEITNKERKFLGLKKPNKIDRQGRSKTDNLETYRHFTGTMITPTNRNSIRHVYFIEYLNKKIEESEELNENTSLEELPEDLKQDAAMFANMRVNVEKKAFKAFLKSKRSFTYKNRFFDVPTEEGKIEMQEKFKAFADMQERLNQITEEE